MKFDSDKLIEDALRDGIREGIKSMATRTYQNPIEDIIKSAIANYANDFRAMLSDALQSCLTDSQFREDVSTQVRHALAKVLVARFGGELEKQVNVLKSDPTTRARITLAIQEIVKSKTS